MGFTSAGLANGGKTTYYQISYDDSFSAADGLIRAGEVQFYCDFDFQLMQQWFNGVDFKYSFPINVRIADATGGASWSSSGPTVTINPGTGTTSNFIRYLLVLEVTEMFMASQNKGWFYDSGDEGSKGEGLSQFLGYQFTLASSILEQYNDGLVPIWLNTLGRPNFVDNNPDDHGHNVTTGCTTCFLYYLHNQLGFSINAIIAAGDSSLGAVYRNLTGKNDGWQSFITLVNLYYPQIITNPSGIPTPFTYHPTSDAIFPVANLSYLSDAQILSGASSANQPVGVELDNDVLAEVVISLSSDNPALLSVPPQYIMDPNNILEPGINLSAAAITGPMQTVAIHATYAGKTVSSTVQILPRPSVLQGLVTDSSLKPITDAFVLLSASAPITPVTGNTMQLSTGGDGSYKTPAITPQLYQVTAGQSGYVDAQATVTVGIGVPVTTLNFVLVAPLPFAITGAVSSQGGGPLAGATVSLGPHSPQATTGPNGGYTLTENPGFYPVSYTLTASLAGFMSSSVTVTIQNGATVIENFVLAQLGSLSGTVKDTSGNAIANATVTAGAVSGSSDHFGAYSLTGLNPVLTEVSASAPRYDPTQTQVLIAPGAHVVHDITLTPASATLTGTVTSQDDGSPISAQVSVVKVGSTGTDHTGRYTLSAVPAGDHEVQVSAKFFKPQTASIHMNAHQTLEEDFVLFSLHQRPLRSPGGQPE